MAFKTGSSAQKTCHGMLIEKKMCRISASKLFMCYISIIYNEIIKNKVLFATFLVNMLKRIEVFCRLPYKSWTFCDFFNSL
jgi:hypothetical protein